MKKSARSARKPRLSESVIRLIDGLSAGKQAALAELYDCTIDEVFRVATAYLKSVEDAQEVVSDAYWHVWKQRLMYDGTRGSIIFWLCSIARYRAIDRLRSRRHTLSFDDRENRQLAESVMAPAPGSDQILMRLQAKSDLHAALKMLSPRRRRLLGLSFFRGLSHQEIANATGRPLGTIKSDLRRALVTLKEAMAGTAGYSPSEVHGIRYRTPDY